MMRLLCELTATLEKVPSERFISMKMEYNETCPEDFATPGFVELDMEQMAAYFQIAPEVMCALMAQAYRCCRLRLRLSTVFHVTLNTLFQTLRSIVCCNLA